jgi:hypothetical protein
VDSVVRAHQQARWIRAVGLPDFHAGPPHVLFQSRFARSGTGIPSFDVDKDGRFLMVPDPRAEQAATQVNIVLNWFEELKKLVPAR